MNNTETLGEALPREIKRNQELIPLYLEIPTGKFAAMLIQQDIDRAIKALAEGDVVQMLVCYNSLKEHKE